MKIDIRVGNCLDVLKAIPDGSIHCCVTSPPYWGLRDYGVEGQFGMEDTPEEYVAHMVEVFREVKRVLRDDGTLWLNLGDSYATHQSGGKNTGHNFRDAEVAGDIGYTMYRSSAKDIGLKEKDLVGIPWMVAFALRADGWYLRNDIIWAKVSCMPESCEDRCTKAHEHIFLLAKNRHYFFDADAIKEPCEASNPDKKAYRPKYAERCETGERFEGNGKNGKKAFQVIPKSGRNKRDVWTLSPSPYPESHFATFPVELPLICIKAGTSEKGCCSKCGAPWKRITEHNELCDEGEPSIKKLDDKPYAVKQRVGTIAIRKLPDMGEFKTYLSNARKNAGLTIEEVEAKFGSQAPHHWFNGEAYPPKEDWVRIKEMLGLDGTYDEAMTREYFKPAEKMSYSYETIGWQPTCKCSESDVVPCTVLDPFAGSGTTGQVARKLNRNSLLIELNPKYAKLIKKRTMAETPDITEWEDGE